MLVHECRTLSASDGHAYIRVHFARMSGKASHYHSKLDVDHFAVAIRLGLAATQSINPCTVIVGLAIAADTGAWMGDDGNDVIATVPTEIDSLDTNNNINYKGPHMFHVKHKVWKPSKLLWNRSI